MIEAQRFRTGRWTALLTMVLVLGAQAAQASIIPSGALTLDIGQSIKLNLLTAGEIPGVVVGDKLFKEFVYSWAGDMPAPENVNVTAIVDSNQNYGIRFQGTFIDLPGDTSGSDASVSFTVNVTDGRHKITDAHLASAIFADTTTPGSFGSIDESFLGNSPQILGTMHVFKSTMGQGGQKFEDNIVFDSTYEVLRVQKDIFALAAQTANAPVRMTFIDQTFSQVDTEVPEPSTASLMLVFGCVTLSGLSRQRVG